MDPTIIYDALSSGTDNTNVCVVIVLVMATALFIYVARLRGASERQGHPFVSRRRAATMVWTFVGKHSTGAIATACILCLGVSVPLLMCYERDRELLENGGYAV